MQCLIMITAMYSGNDSMILINEEANHDLADFVFTPEGSDQEILFTPDFDLDPPEEDPDDTN